MANSAPPAQGHYVPARRHRDLIFVSGMTPRNNGELLFAGRLPHDVSLDACRAAVELATRNALLAAGSVLTTGERLSVLNLTMFINAHQDFTQHSALADFASRLIERQFGRDDLPSRAAIGVASLPHHAMIEVSLVAAVIADMG